MVYNRAIVSINLGVNMHKSDYIGEFDRIISTLRDQYLNGLSSSKELELIEIGLLPQVAKERRKKLSLSQAALAELTGLAIRTIIKFEQGDDGISLKHVKIICAGLGIKLCLKN